MERTAKSGLWRPLVLVGLGVLVIVAVAARVGGSGGDDDLGARLARAETRTEALQNEVADLEVAGERQAAELAEAAAPFAPEFLAAIEQVRSDVVDGACGLGRSSAREDQSPPATEGVVRVVVAGAEAAHPVLVTVEDWSSLLDVEAAGAEAQRCHGDEMLVIGEEQRAADEARLAAEEAERAAEEEEERAVAEEEEREQQEPPPAALETCEDFLEAVQTAGRPPSSGEIQYLWIECGIDYRG